MPETRKRMDLLVWISNPPWFDFTFPSETNNIRKSPIWTTVITSVVPLRHRRQVPSYKHRYSVFLGFTRFILLSHFLSKPFNQFLSDECHVVLPIVNNTHTNLDLKCINPHNGNDFNEINRHENYFPTG